MIGLVVSSEPDLVHAIVEADDAVIGYRLADIGNEALWDQWKGWVVRFLGGVFFDLLLDGPECREVPVLLDSD